MNKLLIDANIYSHAMRGEDEVVTILQHVTRIGISAVSIGELLSGFKAGNREETNRQELNVFLDSPRVDLYYVDEVTAESYSAILDQLKNSVRQFQRMISGLPQRLCNMVYQFIPLTNTSNTFQV